MRVQDRPNSTTEQGLTCSSDIAFQVKNGTAIVFGIACSNEDIVQAENAVNSMSGINHVFNLMTTD